VEAAGIEPASRNSSTPGIYVCSAGFFSRRPCAPALALGQTNPGTSRSITPGWSSRGQPADGVFAQPRAFRAKTAACLVRQRERNHWLLRPSRAGFYGEARDPRHASWSSRKPVETGVRSQPITHIASPQHERLSSSLLPFRVLYVPTYRIEWVPSTPRWPPHFW
jgi:hypothetical protein